ncbi:MAG: ribose-phosphate diphosphokinase [Arenicellales bacterium]|jgi:ribose-phosphate pyrophosphokinase
MADRKPLLVLGFPEYADQSTRLAAALNGRCEIVDIHHFPDGESRVQLPVNLPAHVVLCRSLNRPNEKLVELLLAARAAREFGAHRLTLVAPYLCYMRQDKAFNPGEAVSQAIIGGWLAGLFERVITVDPHLHRTATLSQALPGTEAVTLSAAPLMGEYLRTLPGTPFLIAPDEEAQQWVARIAQLSGSRFVVASKQRNDDRDVHVDLPDGDWRGQAVVVVDDIVSTGETMAAAVRLAKAGGAAQVHCMATHALFCGDALDLLKAAGADNIVSSDSVSHVTNGLRLASVLAAAIS